MSQLSTSRRQRWDGYGIADISLVCAGAGRHLDVQQAEVQWDLN